MIKLQCFNKADHNSHKWFFEYDHPKTEYTCNGVNAKESDSDE